MLMFAQTDDMRKHGLQSPDKSDYRTLARELPESAQAYGFGYWKRKV
jgi:hypothetical protein